MSSTLIIRKTPKPSKSGEMAFKQPLKGFIGRKFYGHDGSCGGGIITVGADHLEWFEGILAAGNFDKSEREDLEKIVSLLREGETIDMWFEF
jgi:hypothetical protein